MARPTRKIILCFILLSLFLFGCTHGSALPRGSQSSTSPPITSAGVPGDYQAKFAIFTHGTFRVFEASMYHNLSTEAYIESSSPNTVKIKKPGVTWADFFNTLPFKLTTDCLTTGTGQTFCTEGRDTLKFYINGKLTPNALSQPISPDGELLVSYGHETDSEIQAQLDQLSSL